MRMSLAYRETSPFHRIALDLSHNIPTDSMGILLQAERGQKRLQFLLKQAEVFQHFAPAASEKEKK